MKSNIYNLMAHSLNFVFGRKSLRDLSLLQYTTPTTVCCKFVVWFSSYAIQNVRIVLWFREHSLLLLDTGL
jgi:hypothetical protein